MRIETCKCLVMTFGLDALRFNSSVQKVRSSKTSAEINNKIFKFACKTVAFPSEISEGPGNKLKRK